MTALAKTTSADRTVFICTLCLHSLFILWIVLLDLLSFLLSPFFALYFQHHEVFSFPAGFARITNMQDTSPTNSPISPNQTSSIRQ